MRLDGHIHIRALGHDRGRFRAALGRAGMDGGVVISLPPPVFPAVAPSLPPAERIDNVLRWCGEGEDLYPFYWIDPTDADAADQVALAARKGVMGFKIICDRYPPADPRVITALAAVSESGRPVLFHSGILWDGKPSSPYNRPAEFEALLEVRGLRFALAHISWPWCDELVAVYGKFLHAMGQNPDTGVEMFIDITPGTPPIYRREALAKLYTVGYDIENNVLFGTDCCANDYNVTWARQWIDRDTEILGSLGVSAESREAAFGGNLRRFVGLTSERIARKAPRPGE